MEINVGTYTLVNTIIQIVLMASQIQRFVAMEKIVEINHIANLTIHKPTSPKTTYTNKNQKIKRYTKIWIQNLNQIPTN